MRWLVVSCCLASTTARAEQAGGDEVNDVVARPLVVAADHLELALVAAIDLAPGMFARPLSLAPDAWFGVSSQLTVGLIHSAASIDRIASAASLCVRTDDLTCPHPYRGSGLDVLWSARAGQFAVAPHARLLLRDVDPMKPAVTVGASLKWTRGRTAIASDPFLQLGLANTDRGNRSALWIPIVAMVQPMARSVVELHTGWNSDLVVVRDGWHVPAELAIRVRATRELDVLAGVGFTSILGPQNTPKERLAIVAVGWRS